MPRYATQVAMARNARQVITLIGLFSHRPLIVSEPDHGADELVEELHRHAGQVGQHDDRRDHRGPAAEPADVRAERLRVQVKDVPLSGMTVLNSR